MKFNIRFSVWLLLFSAGVSMGTAQTNEKSRQKKISYLSLSGETLARGNKIEADGNIHQVELPVVRLFHTKSKSPHGTVLLLPGGGYETIIVENQGSKIAQFLTEEGFNVAILEYHIGSGTETRNLALNDVLQAFRLLQAKSEILRTRGNRMVMMGIASGGHLAARAVQKLGSTEQPDDLILISPSYLNETSTGTVFPSVMPPIQPTARLFSTFSANDNQSWIVSCQEYVKTWRGYDGNAAFTLLNDSAFVANTNVSPLDNNHIMAKLLKSFLTSGFEPAASLTNPAALPVEGHSKKRHADKLELVANHKYELILIGNSITNNFEKPEFQPVWNQYFAPRNALNLGFSGYRTENLLWNIQNGELEGQSPKVVVLEIGTNNIDEKNYPTRHTAGQLAGGIEAVVKLLRNKLPDTKIIIMRCFPGSYGGPNPTSHRLILERASDIVSRLADGKHIFYCDVNHVFLNLDGSINQDMMGDWLHPTPAGAKAWAQGMEPLLSDLMDDKSLDTDIPQNSAIVPVPKLEDDSYDWWARHADVLQIKDSIDPEIVLIGNSITHFWGGEPQLRWKDGSVRQPNGPKAWKSAFGDRRVLNLGFGWDRTQNVLWRLDHGELDGLHPKTVIIHIGTNNTSQTLNARMNTASEIVDGIRTICMRVRSKVPDAKIVLMAVFPREESPTHPRRLLINQTNKELEVFTKENQIRLVDIGPKMLAPDGTLPREIAGDFCHPTEKGYQIWADEIRAIITEP